MRRLLFLCVLATGCSFPDPTISDLPEEDTSIDTSVATDAQTEAAADSSVAETSVQDGGDEVDARDTAVTDAPMDTRDVGVCETGNACDCDGDGDEKPGAGCGGADCDDGDKRRNSLVTSYQSYDATGLAHGGDWNCNTTIEREFGNGGFVCSGLSIGGTSCTAATGYKEATPTCGTMKTKVTCKVSLGFCVTDTETMVRVICK